MDEVSIRDVKTIREILIGINENKDRYPSEYDEDHELLLDVAEDLLIRLDCYSHLN